MAKEEIAAKFFVVLRDAFTATELGFIQKFSNGIKLEDGTKLRQFQCSSVDVSGMYLELEVIVQGQTDTLPVKIPHTYVLFIYGRHPDLRWRGFLSD